MNHTDIVVARLLRDLQHGLPPALPLVGICGNVHRVLMLDDHTGHGGYRYCSRLFKIMNLNHDDPLGIGYRTGDKWDGCEGLMRRHLCGQMADCIETELI